MPRNCGHRTYAKLISAILTLTLSGFVLSSSPVCAAAAKVHGVATLSSGAPLANGTVSLVDSTGHTASAPTNSRGKFSISVDPSAAPYLLQTTPPNTGVPLYGFALSPGTADIDVYTDLILNMVYAALSTTTTGQFEAAAPIPSGQSKFSMGDNLQLVSPLTKNLILTWLVTNKVKLSNFDLMSYRFSANGRKFAKLLQQTSITSPYSEGSETISITNGAITQTLTFTGTAPAGQSTTGNVAVNSVLKTGSHEITNAPSTAILVNAEQAAEFEGVQALLHKLQTTVRGSGKKLTANDLQPLFNPSSPPYLRGGEDLKVGTADEATSLRGVTMSNVAIAQLDSIQPDKVVPSTNDVSIIYQYNITKTLVSQGIAEVFQCPDPFLSGSTCNFVGNQQIAQTTDAVTAVTSTTSDLTNNNATGPALQVDVLAPENTLSAASIDDADHVYFNGEPVPRTNVVTPSFFPNPDVPLSPPFVEDEFSLLLPLTSNIPPAGMDFSITVTPAAGGASLTYLTSLSGSAGEPIALLQPPLTGDHSLSSAPIGKSMVVKWGPSPYALESINLSGLVIADCGSAAPAVLAKALTPKSTSGTLKFPAQVKSAGDIQEVDINLAIVGVNGASSHLLYRYGQCIQ